MSFSVLSYSFSCAPLRWTSVYLKCEFYLFTFAHPSFRVKYYLFYLNFPLFEFFFKFWFEISFYLDIHFLIQYVLFYIIEVPAILLSFLLSSLLWLRIFQLKKNIYCVFVYDIYLF